MNGPSMEIIDRPSMGIRYLQHGWPSDLIRWHAHEPYELHLMVATRGKVFVGDHIGRFEPGQFILTGPRVPHNWVTDPDAGFEPVALRDMVIQFDGGAVEQLANLFPEASELLPLLAAARCGVAFDGFDFDESQNRMAAVRDARGMERLRHFLALLQRLAGWTGKTRLSTIRMESLLSGVFESKINAAVQYVVDHYQDEIYLEQVAERAGMSGSAFSRKFREATGNKFVDFVNRVRIGRACVLLSETNDRISSICYAVGFNNVANFNRRFAKLKGRTPGEYRNATRRFLAGGEDVAIAEISRD